MKHHPPKFIFFFITLFGFISCNLKEDQDIHLAIKTHKLEAVRGFIESGKDINAIYEGYSLLSFAIKYDKHGTIVRYLLENGADANQVNNGKSPLTYAAKYGRSDLVELLVHFNADPNKVSDSGKNALMYAIKYQQIDTFKKLLSVGADPNKDLGKGRTTTDFAKHINHPEILRILNMAYKPKLSTDGPYIFDKDENYEVITVDSNQNPPIQTYKISKSTQPTFIVLVDGTDDRFEIQVTDRYETPESEYPEPKKSLAISDLEGNFYALKRILIGNKVMDSSFNWTFGTGHLIVPGDIFDRGKNVLPCLWLLYKLEQQAKKSGGMVHLILGNHEFMNFAGDTRYVKPKYLDLAYTLNIKYPSLFDTNTVLGRWLRTKNIIEKIGYTVYTHGGLSPELVERNLSIQEINTLAQTVLANPKNLKADETIQFITGEKGPLWFRGYFINEISQHELDKIATHYNVERIVVGHTVVKTIEPRYKNKVIAIDIKHPKSATKGDVHAFYIEDGQTYSVSEKGLKRAL